MDDLIFCTEAGYLLVGKVRSVVRDDGVGELKATHYALSEELDNLLSGDF